VLYEEPDPDPIEARKLIEKLCQQLRLIEKDVPADMRAELQGYISSLEEGSQTMVGEFNDAKASYETAVARSQAQAAAPPPAPTVPAEEDVLPLGLALRAQLLGRYRVVKAAAPAQEDFADVAGMGTGEFQNSGEHKPGTGIRHAAADPKPKPRPKPDPKRKRGDDAWDISSGEWNKD
jgi:hypothetical protein